MDAAIEEKLSIGQLGGVDWGERGGVGCEVLLVSGKFMCS